jgi:hypothetical protein
MTLQETASRIFPGRFLSDEHLDDGFLEVQGLPRSATLQNCEVLASGQFQYRAGEMYRSSYLVRADQLVLLVRMIPASFDRMSAQISLTQ